MSDSVYHCSYCDTTITKSSTPSAGGCSKNSIHNWIGLGDVGDKNYQCSYCNIVVKTDSTPNAASCSSNEPSHYWIEM